MMWVHHNTIFEREKLVATEAKKAGKWDLLAGEAEGYQAFIQAAGSADAGERSLIVQGILEEQRDALIAKHATAHTIYNWSKVILNILAIVRPVVTADLQV